MWNLLLQLLQFRLLIGFVLFLQLSQFLLSFGPGFVSTSLLKRSRMVLRYLVDTFYRLVQLTGDILGLLFLLIFVEFVVDGRNSI